MPWPPYGRSESGAEFLGQRVGLTSKIRCLRLLRGWGIVRATTAADTGQAAEDWRGNPQEGLDS